ncbi:unnamed protein product [Linum trigynum]|uniref:Reverse transcriptase zinc-binding domain-containing protein n=1 Tax=Linum trigynum TaxID=586398 RepID=A0AAV2GIY7_9ROSI
METREHLFMHCSFAHLLVLNLHCRLFEAGGWDAMMAAVCSLVQPSGKLRWHGVVWCMVLTCIWRERCRVVHGGALPDPEKVATQLQADLRYLVAGNAMLQGDLESLGYL